jgi:hypothetical protein
MSISFRHGSAAISALEDLIGLSTDAQITIDIAIDSIRSEMRAKPDEPASAPPAPPADLTPNEAKVVAAIRAGLRSSSAVSGMTGLTSQVIGRICGGLVGKGVLVPAGYFFRLTEFEPNRDYAEKGRMAGAKAHKAEICEFLEGESSGVDPETIKGVVEKLTKVPIWEVIHILHALAEDGAITCDGRTKLWRATKS